MEDDLFENLPDVADLLENLPDVAPGSPTTADETADISADEPQAKRVRGAAKTVFVRTEWDPIPESIRDWLHEKDPLGYWIKCNQGSCKIKTKRFQLKAQFCFRYLRLESHINQVHFSPPESQFTLDSNPLTKWLAPKSFHSAPSSV